MSTQIVSVHPGLCNEELSQIKATEKLPNDVAQQIDDLMNLLMHPNGSSIHHRESVLIKLVDLTTRYRPTNFTEYLWYVRFTSCMMLLQNTPILFCTKQSQLLMHTFQIPTDQWDACPIKIHVISKALFAQLDDDYNLVFLVKQICNLNRLAYYVSVSLMWAALYRFVGQPTKMFRMHKISDLIDLLAAIDLNSIEMRLNDVHRFLTMLSVFQSLVILRKARYEEYVCFRSFFRSSDADMSMMKEWLEKLKSLVEQICSKKRDNDNCLQIIEMLDLDILHFMNQVLKPSTSSDF